MSSRAVMREIAIVYAVVSAVTFALTRLRALPAAGEYVHLMVGALFLLVAMRLAQRSEGDSHTAQSGMRRHGIDLAGLLEPSDDEGPRGLLGLRDLWRAVRRSAPSGLRELGVALGVAALIFPPFTLGFHFYYGPEQPFTLQLPDEPGSFALAQLLVVALPEEALFRGYFQTRLTDAWPRTVSILGVRVSPGALVVQSALFAVIHFIVDLHPARLAVFFPGLMFGWLRQWRGGIGAAIAMHALSNLFSDLLVRGWL